MSSHTFRSTITSGGLIISLLLTALLSFQCFKQPLSPVAPSWDVQLSVPLLDTTRIVDELIKKDPSVIQINSTTNFITYSFSQPAFSDSVADKIKMSPQGSRLGVAVGPIRITDVQVSNPVPSPVPPGTYPFFPARTVRTGALTVTAPGFSNLVFQSGTAELVITNNLPIPFAFPEPITLTDGLGRIVASFSGISGNIAPGVTRSDSVSLANKATNNSIKVSSTPARDSITINFPRDTTNVTFTSQNNIAFAIRFKNIVATSATAQIPAQSVLSQDSTVFVVDDSNFVQFAIFKSGNFAINIASQVDLDMTVRLRLPQLLKQNNSVFDSTILVAPKGTASFNFDMRQLKVQSTTARPIGNLVYTLQIAQLGSSGTQQRTISAGDSVVASINITQTPFIVKSASAVIKPTPLDIDQLIGLRLGDLPSKFSVDSIRLPDANFILGLNTPGFPARVSAFRIFAKKVTASRTVIDTIRYRIDAPVNLQPGVVNRLVLNDANSTIIDVLNRFVSKAKALPDSFRILGNGLLNPNYDTTAARTIADTSKIAGNFDVDFPLNIGIKNGTVRDTFRIKEKIRISQEDINNLNSSTLMVFVQNSMPAGLLVSIDMLDSNMVRTRTFPSTGPIVVSAASVGSDGFSNQSALSNIVLTINKDDVKALVNAKFITAVIQLNTSSSASSVRFRTRDSIKMRMFGTVSYRVTPGRK